MVHSRHSNTIKYTSDTYILSVGGKYIEEGIYSSNSGFMDIYIEGKYQNIKMDAYTSRSGVTVKLINTITEEVYKEVVLERGICTSKY